eukprot:COSAG01_NODE_3031_length_6698_cov_4.212305_3_plen_49_part_00
MGGNVTAAHDRTNVVQMEYSVKQQRTQQKHEANMRREGLALADSLMIE